MKVLTYIVSSTTALTIYLEIFEITIEYRGNKI